MLDFAVNVWLTPRPTTLEHALRDALADSHRYPDQRKATAAVAARHGRQISDVLLLNGACDAFWALAQTFRPRHAACVHPSFTEPEAALLAVGSHVIHVLREPQHWRFDPDDVPEEADMVVLGNPNNPTGTLESPDTITALARPGRLLVVDESFIDFVPSQAASLAERSDVPGLIVVRSLSKIWSVSGIRAGYLLAPADIVDQLATARQPWSVNTLACAALAFCAGDRETPRQVAMDVARERNDLAHALARLPGLETWPSEANFLLTRTPHGPQVVDDLLLREIAVRSCASFPGLDDNHIRIAVRNSEDNARLVEALDVILREYDPLRNNTEV